MINTYNNLSDYEAGRESRVSETTLFHLTNPNILAIKGYNVEVKDPKIGDIACYDPEGKVHFIALDTWNYPATSEFKSMAVAVEARARDIKFVSKSVSSQKWAVVYRWIVSGYESVTSAEVKLQNTVIGTMTDLDGTAATLVGTFNALVAEYKAAHTEWTLDYHMYVADSDGTVYLIWDTYTADPSNTTIAGITLTAAVGTEIPANSSVVRKNGISTYFAGMNLLRFIQYYSVSGTTPTAPVSLTDTAIMNQTSFENSSYCQLLRDTYGSYETYMDSNMAKCPNTVGIMAPEYRDGLWNTNQLAYVTYKDKDGIDQFLYPAPHYTKTIGFSGVKGFEPGDGYMPSVYDGMDIFPKLTRGLGGNYSAVANQDPINRSLIAIGGSGISVSSHNYPFISKYISIYSWCNYVGYGKTGPGVFVISYLTSSYILPLFNYRLSFE